MSVLDRRAHAPAPAGARLRILGAVVATIAVAVAMAGCSSSRSSAAQNVTADKEAAAAASLKLADLPAGWTSTPTTPDAPGVDSTLAACLGLRLDEITGHGPADAQSPEFSDSNNNSISNAVGYTPSTTEARRQLAAFRNAKAASCQEAAISAELSYQTTHPDSTGAIPPGISFGNSLAAPIPFPSVGDQSVAYRAVLPVNAAGQKFDIYMDSVYVDKGRAFIEMDFESYGFPFPSASERRYLLEVVGRLANT